LHDLFIHFGAAWTYHRKYVIRIPDRVGNGTVRTTSEIGAFLQQLQYKARWNGVQLVKVDRFFTSSKTCFACGSRQPLKLSERSWQCAYMSACGCRPGSEIHSTVSASQSVFADSLIDRLHDGLEAEPARK